MRLGVGETKEGYNPSWQYHVLATTHQDHDELYKLMCPGYWSGNSDATENSNDGKATMIHVSKLSHPYQDCRQHP